MAQAARRPQSAGAAVGSRYRAVGRGAPALDTRGTGLGAAGLGTPDGSALRGGAGFHGGRVAFITHARLPQEPAAVSALGGVGGDVELAEVQNAGFSRLTPRVSPRWSSAAGDHKDADVEAGGEEHAAGVDDAATAGFVAGGAVSWRGVGMSHALGALYGVVSVLILVPINLGYSSVLIGDSALAAPLLGPVAAMQFLGTAFFAILFAVIDKSTHASLASIQDPGILFLATAVNAMSKRCSELDGCGTSDLASATFIAVCMGTLCTAVAFGLLSFVPQLIQAVTYIPLPVVGGFLASIGAFIMQGGFSLALQRVEAGGEDATGWGSIALSLASKENIMAAVLSCGYGALLFGLVRMSSHPMVLPMAMSLPVPLFYIVIAVSNWTMEDAVNQHLFFTAQSYNSTHASADSQEQASTVFPPAALGFLNGELSWSAGMALISETSGLWPLLPNMVGAVVVSTLLLNTLGVETTLGLTIDYKAELRLLALTNGASAACGGVPGTRSYMLTILTSAGLDQAPVKSRAAGLSCGVLFIVLYIFDVPLLEFVPKFLFSGVLLFVGADLMVAWLLQSRRSMGLADFVVVWVGFLAIQLLGINTGMGVAVLVSIVFFIIQYARVPVIKRTDVRRANTFRLASERLELDKLDRTVLGYQVSGALFFATARQLISVIIKDVEAIIQRTILLRAANSGEGPTSPPQATGGSRKRRLRGWATAPSPGKSRKSEISVDEDAHRDPDGVVSAEKPRVVFLDCTLMQGLDASAAQVFTRLRRMLQERGVLLVLGAVPSHVWQLLLVEGGIVDGTTQGIRPLSVAAAIAFQDYDAAVEWVEDQLLHGNLDPSSSIRSRTSGSEPAAGAGDDVATELSDNPRPSGTLVDSFTGYLDAQGVDDLLHYATRLVFEAGKELFSQGSPADRIFLVSSGRVALVRADATGSKSKLLNVTPGGIVGDLDYALDESRSFSCVAVERSVVFEITRTNRELLKRRHPHLEIALQGRQLRDMCVHTKDVEWRRVYDVRRGAAQDASI